MAEVMRETGKEKAFKSTDVLVTIFKDTNIAELQICHLTGDFDKGLSLVEDIVEGMEENEGKLHKEQIVSFYYHIAYIYFGAGKYNKALFWINKVLNDNENTLRQDIYSYARLFNLVIHYELGNHDVLQEIMVA